MHYKQIIQTVKVVTIALIFTFSVNYLYAATWKGPTANPPQNNVDAPINVGGIQQDKIGSLRVGGFRSFGPALFDVNVGIGTLNPSEKLHVEGGKFRLNDGTEGEGKVLTSNRLGVASWKSVQELLGNTTNASNNGVASQSKAGTICGGYVFHPYAGMTPVGRTSIDYWGCVSLPASVGAVQSRVDHGDGSYTNVGIPLSSVTCTSSAIARLVGDNSYLCIYP